MSTLCMFEWRHSILFMETCAQNIIEVDMRVPTLSKNVPSDLFYQYKYQQKSIRFTLGQNDGRFPRPSHFILDIAPLRQIVINLGEETVVCCVAIRKGSATEGPVGKMPLCDEIRE